MLLWVFVKYTLPPLRFESLLGGGLFGLLFGFPFPFDIPRLHARLHLGKAWLSHFTFQSSNCNRRRSSRFSRYATSMSFAATLKARSVAKASCSRFF